MSAPRSCFTAQYYSVVRIHPILFILRQLLDVSVISPFWLFQIRVRVFTWACVFIDLGCLPRSGSARSRGDLKFHLLRTCQTVLHSGWTTLHSGVLLCTPPHQSVLSCVLSVVMLGAWGGLFLFIYLYFFHDEWSDHLLCLLPICTPCLVKCLFRPFAYFFKFIFIF